MRISALFKILASAVLVLPVSAQTLQQAFELAKNSEPSYMSSIANLTVSQEKSKQAVAAVLPQITASLSTNTNYRDYLTRDSSIPPASDHYNSHNHQLNFTQPLLNHAKIIALKQAEATASQADQQLMATEQDLAVKLISAWCEVMQARDNVLFTSRQTQATQEQWNILNHAVKIGTQADPAREEARAKYDQALSDHITAETEVQIKMATLEQLTGPLTAFAPPFITPAFKSRLTTLYKEHGHELLLDGLLQEAEQKNPTILATQHALDAAMEEINKQRAGHEPTLDIVGSYGSNNQNAGNFPGQSGYEISQKTLGLQFNLPLFSGGGQLSKTNEAIAMAEKARQDLEGARRAARLVVKQAWFGWRAAEGRYKASLQLLKSSGLALKAASSGKRIGLKIEWDRLQAQQQLESARKDLNKALYDMATSLFKLKASAGQLQYADIQLLDQMFSSSESDWAAWIKNE